MYLAYAILRLSSLRYNNPRSRQNDPTMFTTAVMSNTGPETMLAQRNTGSKDFSPKIKYINYQH